MVYLFHTTCISIDLAHHEIFRAKVGQGGINVARLRTPTIKAHHSVPSSHSDE